MTRTKIGKTKHPRKTGYEKTPYEKTPPYKKHPLLAKFFPRAITGRAKMEKSK